jgi:hypothetical protein
MKIKYTCKQTKLPPKAALAHSTGVPIFTEIFKIACMLYLIELLSLMSLLLFYKASHYLNYFVIIHT